MSRYPRGQNGQHDRMLATQFLDAIVDERHRAHDKHGATSMEQAPLLAHKRASVLTEEAMECAKALNDHDHGDINLRDGRSNPAAPDLVDPLDKELIQTAAMAYTWWANRRGDRLDPPAPEPTPITQVVRVVFNGLPYYGTIDPATGNVLISTIDPPRPPVVEVTAEQARAMGMMVREPECVANWPGCYPGGYEPRCCRFPKACAVNMVVAPPADDPDGGRRAD